MTLTLSGWRLFSWRTASILCRIDARDELCIYLQRDGEDLDA